MDNENRFQTKWRSFKPDSFKHIQQSIQPETGMDPRRLDNSPQT